MKGNEYGGDAQVGRVEVIKRDRGLSVAVQTDAATGHRLQLVSEQH